MPTMAGLRGERALVGLAASAVALVAILLIAVIYGLQRICRTSPEPLPCPFSAAFQLT